MAAGHEQPIALSPAKADIGAAFGQADVADGLALGVEHSHAVEFLHIGFGITVTSPAAPQVAAFVAFDAVDGRVVEPLDVFAPLAQRAVFVDRYRPILLKK
ncbi:hypothetical protein AL047_04215 [Pseudomonas syringae pv. broussonetiae]|nr:hypothetical protein AL047_04215 [Pseudomonas syringae pv. broussonetiae]